MHFAALLNVLLRSSSLPAGMQLDGLLALCLPLRDVGDSAAAARTAAPLCVLDNLLHGDNAICVKQTALELCCNLYRREFACTGNSCSRIRRLNLSASADSGVFRALQRLEPAGESHADTSVKMFDEVITMLRSQVRLPSSFIVQSRAAW
jgi:hypothetical protein